MTTTLQKKGKTESTSNGTIFSQWFTSNLFGDLQYSPVVSSSVLYLKSFVPTWDMTYFVLKMSLTKSLCECFLGLLSWILKHFKKWHFSKVDKCHFGIKLKSCLCFWWVLFHHLFFRLPQGDFQYLPVILDLFSIYITMALCFLSTFQWTPKI